MCLYVAALVFEYLHPFMSVDLTFWLYFAPMVGLDEPVSGLFLLDLLCLWATLRLCLGATFRLCLIYMFRLSLAVTFATSRLCVGATSRPCLRATSRLLVRLFRHLRDADMDYLDFICARAREAKIAREAIVICAKAREARAAAVTCVIGRVNND